MNQDQFHSNLREFLHREPFTPFVIELKDGRRIFVDYPSVVFSGEFAGYLSETDLTSFRCDEVARIFLAPAEANS